MVSNLRFSKLSSSLVLVTSLLDFFLFLVKSSSGDMTAPETVLILDPEMLRQSCNEAIWKLYLGTDQLTLLGRQAKAFPHPT